MTAPSPAPGPSVEDAVDDILRDGTTLRLRPPTSADADALVAFFAGLSAESLGNRFHGARRVDPALVEPFLDPDWAERGALVGTVGADGGERVVALADYTRLRDPGSAEVAFVVADELQRRGLGTRLLEQLAARAAAAGIEAFVAEVMAGNRPMLDVFQGVDERDHVAVVASLRPFFSPASVAVIGASRRRGSIGGELFRNVLAADF